MGSPAWFFQTRARRVAAVGGFPLRLSIKGSAPTLQRPRGIDGSTMKGVSGSKVPSSGSTPDSLNVPSRTGSRSDAAGRRGSGRTSWLSASIATVSCDVVQVTRRLDVPYASRRVDRTAASSSARCRRRASRRSARVPWCCSPLGTNRPRLVLPSQSSTIQMAPAMTQTLTNEKTTRSPERISSMNSPIIGRRRGRRSHRRCHR